MIILYVDAAYWSRCFRSKEHSGLNEKGVEMQQAAQSTDPASKLANPDPQQS